MTAQQQRATALEHANEVRTARCQLKRRIASGDVFAASVLLKPPPEAFTCPVAVLLATQRGWGKDKTRKLLGRLEIRETKPLGELTDRQRRALAEAL